MSEIKFKILKKGKFYIAVNSLDTKISYGKINIETGKCLGGTLCFEALREHLESKKVVVKTSYKVWMVIEKHIEFEDGSEKFEDLEDTRSAGRFDTRYDACKQMHEIGDQYEGDFTK